MKNQLLLAALLSVVGTPAVSQSLDFLSTPTKPMKETFYGITVDDPYRHLENIHSEDVQQWVKVQSKAAELELLKLKFNSNALATISRNAYAKFELPLRQGKYYFQYMHVDVYSGPGLYYQKTLNGRPVLLVDPRVISTRDKISLATFSLSKDSKFLAYQYHRDGTDWAEIRVIGMNGKHQKDHLTGVKFSDIYWQGNGFYYSVFHVSDSLSALRNEVIYYHTLGDKQENDRLVFRRAERPFAQIRVLVTSDERYLIIREIEEAMGLDQYFIQDALDTSALLKSFLRHPDRDLDILDSHDGYIYAKSLHNGKLTLVKTDPENALNWVEVFPEASGMTMVDAMILEHYIAVVYQSGPHQNLVFYAYNGNIVHLEYLPEFCALGDLSGNKYDEDLIYYYTSYLVPPIVYSINLTTFKTTLLQKTKVTFDYKDFEIREKEYRSKDGTLVPMTVIHKKGLVMDGKNPTLLSAYGGFGVMSKPSFKPELVYFMEEGGVFAFAKIRGGGEKGPQWHQMGSGQNKQNSFDDFIAAAEYLIREKYTSPRHLAITGSSNGGLVVGVAMTQRPDLFAVAVPEVGVFDMLRFEKFTIGTFHLDEYGSVTNEAGFKQLLAYSPLHHINPGVNYPATLIITAENDDRVPPFHSYKFAAALQNNPGQTNPIMLWVAKDAGHNGDQSALGHLEYLAGMYSFILKYTR